MLVNDEQSWPTIPTLATCGSVSWRILCTTVVGLLVVVVVGVVVVVFVDDVALAAYHYYPQFPNILLPVDHHGFGIPQLQGHQGRVIHLLRVVDFRRISLVSKMGVKANHSRSTTQFFWIGKQHVQVDKFESHENRNSQPSVTENTTSHVPRLTTLPWPQRPKLCCFPQQVMHHPCIIHGDPHLLSDLVAWGIVSNMNLLAGWTDPLKKICINQPSQNIPHIGGNRTCLRVC